MRRDDIMKADLISEIVLVGVGCLLFLPFFILLIVSVTKTVGAN
jgi:hypothetical protein